jgi:hypothetical protein
MGMIINAVKKFLFWSYDRGSWQYDLLCTVILAFIFFGPNSVFHSADGATAPPVFVKYEEVGKVEMEAFDKTFSDYFSRKYNRKVKATNVEPLLDSGGNVKGYLVKEIDQ